MGNNTSSAARTPDIPKRRIDNAAHSQGPTALNPELFASRQSALTPSIATQNYNATRQTSRSPSRDERGNPVPHRSMRTKKKSLELPDLATLGMAPYNSAVQRGRAAASSKNTVGYGYFDSGNSSVGSQPIPIPSASGQRDRSSDFDVDAVVERDVDHAHRHKERGRGGYSGSAATDSTARSSNHPSNGNNNFFRGRPLVHNSTRSFGSHASAIANRQQQEAAAVETIAASINSQLTTPTAHTAFVQETVRSILPIPLVESPSDEVLSDGPVGTYIPGTPAYYALGQEPQPVPVTLVWNGGGSNVFLARAGDDEWRGRTAMNRDPPDQTQIWTVTVPLLPGTHHIRFLVDDAWKVADDLPKAVDDQGSFANYVAVNLGGPSTSTTSSSISTATVSPPPPPSTRAVLNGGLNLAMTTPQQSHQRAPIPQNSFWSTSSSTSVDATAVSRPTSHDIELGWTDVIPAGLIAAAAEEDAYLASTVPAQAPNVPPAPGLPRHLDRLILNVKPAPNAATAAGSSAGSGRNSPSSGASPTRRRERDLREGDSGARCTSHSSSNASSPSSTGSRRERERKSSPMMPTTSIASAAEDIISTEVAIAVPVLPVVSPSSALTTGAATGPVAIRLRERERLEGPGLADDTSVLPVPSHVVLQHLSTSAIRNGVLAVGCTVRYRSKYLTTIYYKPT